MDSAFSSDFIQFPKPLGAFYTEESTLRPKMLIFAMEYVDGMTLESWTKKAKKELEVAQAFKSVATVVKKVHDAGYAHLDIKPKNMIEKEGKVTLLDFGCTTPKGSPVPRIIGTPKYMAPEYCFSYFQFHIYLISPTFI